MKDKITKKVKSIRTVESLLALNNMINYMFEKEANDKIMLEVGSYIGESTEIFCKRLKSVYCIDSWNWVLYEEDNGIWSTCSGNPSVTEKLFIENVIYKYKNVHKFKGSSESFKTTFKDEFFDCIYLDADHNYDGVKKDIDIWYPKIKINGYLCGHDYTMEVNDGGVYRAVNEKFRNPDITFNDTSWVIKKLY